MKRRLADDFGAILTARERRELGIQNRPAGSREVHASVVGEAGFSDGHIERLGAIGSGPLEEERYADELILGKVGERLGVIIPLVGSGVVAQRKRLRLGITGENEARVLVGDGELGEWFLLGNAIAEGDAIVEGAEFDVEFAARA